MPHATLAGSEQHACATLSNSTAREYGATSRALTRTCRALFTNAAARPESLSSFSALYTQLRNMAGFEACRSSGLMTRAYLSGLGQLARESGGKVRF